MTLDASIYQGLAAPRPIDIPNPMDSMKNALSLSQLGLQNQQMQRQMAATQALRQAYAANTDPNTGQVNKQGVLSSLGKLGMGQMVPDLSASFSKQDKDAADARAAQADAASKMYNITGPAFDYLNKLPEDQRAQAYPKIIQQLKGQRIDVSNMDHPYDPQAFAQYYGAWQQTKPKLENVLTQAQIGKTNSETMMAPVKLNSELYGSRSPTNTLAEAYNKEIAPIKSSQIAMRQMMDNYNHPSPQGDASLILNAYKIKNPNAPDVNSLEELSKAQGVSDQWKQMATHAIEGGLDQGTRDNLMRDGISAYRANYGTYQDTAEKYKGMAQTRGVPMGGMIYEPALDKTFSETTDLQKKIGPYVPPADRGGIASLASRVGRAILGTGGNQDAKASTKTQAPGGFSLDEIRAELARRKGGKGK